MTDPIQAVGTTAYIESLRVSLEHSRLLICFLKRNPQFEHTTPSLGLYIFKLAFPLILATKVSPPEPHVQLALDIHLKALDQHTLSYENVTLLRETIEYLMTITDPRDLCTQFARFLVHEIKRPSFLQLPEKLMELQHEENASESHTTVDTNYESLFSKALSPSFEKPSMNMPTQPLGIVGNPFSLNYTQSIPPAVSPQDQTYLELLLTGDPFPPNL